MTIVRVGASVEGRRDRDERTHGPESHASNRPINVSKRA